MNEKQLAIEKLDDLKRTINNRKFEINKICHHEKIKKQNFSDLDWVIDKINQLKKTM